MATAPTAAMATCPQFAIALGDAAAVALRQAAESAPTPHSRRAEDELGMGEVGRRRAGSPPGGIATTPPRRAPPSRRPIRLEQAPTSRRELPGPESLGRAVPRNHPPGSARWDHQQPKEAV
jgi:hypothetical protein